VPDESGSPVVKIFDGFIKDNPFLHHTSSEVALGSSQDSAGLVEVSLYMLYYYGFNLILATQVKKG